MFIFSLYTTPLYATTPLLSSFLATLLLNDMVEVHLVSKTQSRSEDRYYYIQYAILRSSPTKKKKKKKQKIEFPSVGSFPVDQAIPGDDTLVCELDKLLNMIRDMQQL